MLSAQTGAKDSMIANFLFRDFSADKTSVQCVVQWVRGFAEGMTTERQQAVTDLLKNMGKWEAVAKLLADLDVSKRTIPQESGYDLYRVTPMLDKENGLLRLSFSLTKEEALRRTRGQTADVAPSIEEIQNQIANLSRWENVAKIVKNLNSELRGPDIA